MLTLVSKSVDFSKLLYLSHPCGFYIAHVVRSPQQYKFFSNCPCLVSVREFELRVVLDYELYYCSQMKLLGILRQRHFPFLRLIQSILCAACIALDLLVWRLSIVSGKVIGMGSGQAQVLACSCIAGLLGLHLRHV